MIWESGWPINGSGAKGLGPWQLWQFKKQGWVDLRGANAKYFHNLLWPAADVEAGMIVRPAKQVGPLKATQSAQ